MVEGGVIERSLSAYPGRVSAVLSTLDPLENINIFKKGLLENPMVSAIFIEDINSLNQLKKYSELVNWAKSNNLNVGLSTSGDENNSIQEVLSNDIIDFIRISIDIKKAGNKGHVEDLKKTLGKIRASGVKYEFCVEINSDLPDVGVVDSLYKSFSPCSNFVIQSNYALNMAKKEKLMGFTSRRKNVILRFWD